MAGARPVRLLAAACMAFFLFLMVRIMRNPADIPPKHADVKGFDRDPNLDRKSYRDPRQCISC